MGNPGIAPHQVVRLAIDVGQPYEHFCTRYESATPEFDGERVAAFVRRNAKWEEVVADAAAWAPHGFFTFWKLDVTPTMALAGNTARCTQYLMGNHTIAERMFRHDPSALLYAPLRTLIYADRDRPTRFVIDQPSTVFSSFANTAIADVGVELDHKLATLLEYLDVPVPEVLALEH
jgi:uncharacterized protein (DUF302 family)